MADRQDVMFTVKIESKYPPKEGGHSYKCDVSGTECYLDTPETLQVGQTYVAAKLTGLNPKGKGGVIYGKIEDAKPVGGPMPAQGAGQTRQALGNQQGHTADAFERLANRIAKWVEGWADGPDLVKAELAGCMWKTMAYNDGVMKPLENDGGGEEGAKGGAPSAVDQHPADDELPPDDNIPF